MDASWRYITSAILIDIPMRRNNALETASRPLSTRGAPMMPMLFDAPQTNAVGSTATGAVQMRHRTPSVARPLTIKAATDGDEIAGNDRVCDSSIDDLSTLAARLLGADACMITLIASDIGDRLTFRSYCGALPADASARKQWTRQGESAARRAIRAGRPLRICAPLSDDSVAGSPDGDALTQHVVASPIRVGRDIVGVINVFTLGTARSSDLAALATAEIVALLVGRSLLALRLESMLHSRFAQLAICAATDCKADRAVALATSGPAKLARILAKSFYREMVRLGCDSGQIVEAASEIISQLSANLKKHRSRLERGAPTNPMRSEPVGSE